MTIKEFIEKSIEGGWFETSINEVEIWEFEDIKMAKLWHTTENGGGIYYSIPVSHILLQPLAWQAVGKVEGWRQVGLTSKDNDHMPDAFYKHQELIAALWHGATIEEFLTTL